MEISAELVVPISKANRSLWHGGTKWMFETIKEKIALLEFVCHKIKDSLQKLLFEFPVHQGQHHATGPIRAHWYTEGSAAGISTAKQLALSSNDVKNHTKHLGVIVYSNLNWW